MKEDNKKKVYFRINQKEELILDKLQKEYECNTRSKLISVILNKLNEKNQDEMILDELKELKKLVINLIGVNEYKKQKQKEFNSLND